MSKFAHLAQVDFAQTCATCARMRANARVEMLVTEVAGAQTVVLRCEVMNLRSNRTRLTVATTLASLLVVVVACDETIEATKLTDAGSAADAAVTEAAVTDAPAAGDTATDAPPADFGTCAGKLGTSQCSPTKASAACKTADGEICDFSNSQARFVCFNGGFTSFADLCQPCDYATKKGCKPGMTCGPSGQCIRYCCADSDCNGHGSCGLPGPFAPAQPNAGICFTEFTDLCSGTPDAGDGGNVTDAADASDAPDDGG